MLLLSQQDSHPGLEGLATDAACDVLCESVWDGPLLEAKIARDALYDLLQLRPASCSKQDRATGEVTIRGDRGSNSVSQCDCLTQMC